jgi:hypothetical protein
VTDLNQIINGANGKQKWTAGLIGAIALALLVWNFSAVYSLQVSASGRDVQLAALRSDFEAQRSSDISFQTEVRNTINNAQTEMRTAITRVGDILTEVRIRLGVFQPDGSPKTSHK